MATTSHKSGSAADFAVALARAASLGGRPAFAVNADGIIAAAANASGKIFGYDAADIVGRRFAGILAGGEAQVAELWARARAKGSVAAAAVKIISSEGNVADASLDAKPVTGDGEEILIATIQPERESPVGPPQEYLLANLPVGIIAVDREFRVTYWSQG